MSFFVNSYFFGKAYQFIRTLDSAGDDRAFSCATDSSGNVYFVGYYSGTGLIKNESGYTILTLPASISSTNCAFLCKFDSSGTYQYTRLIDSTASEQSLAVTCDSSGNVYFGGFYNGTSTIKNDAGTSLGTLPAAGSSAAFVCKFNSSGTYQYSRIIDGSGSDYTQGISCDSSGNIYISGYYTTGAPTIKNETGTSLGTLPMPLGGSSTTAFVSKFNSSGTYQYARLVDASSSAEQGLAVTCDLNGNMYFAGYFGPGAALYNQAGSNLGTFSGTVSQAAFVSKFDSSGVYQYSRVIDGTGVDSGQGLTCDSSGNLYLTGYYTGTATIRDLAGTSLGTLPAPLGGSSTTAFVSKFNSSGTYQYSRLVDASAVADQGLAVACDSSGNIYFSGYYGGTANPNIYNQAGVSLGTLPSSLASTIAGFLCKFDSEGNYLYSRVIDTNSASDTCQGISCDSNTGNVYITGFYSSGNPIIRDQSGTIICALPKSTTNVAYLLGFDSFGNFFTNTGAYDYSIYIDSTAADQSMAVTCDLNGNMYFAGYFGSGAALYNQAGSNLGTFTGPVNQAAFVSKFNSSGVYQYSRTIDGTGVDSGQGLTCDSSGNLYLTGYYTGTATIRDLAGTSLGTLPAPLGGSSTTAFVSKFNSSGTYQYSRLVDASAVAEQGMAVTCDSSGNMYFAGFYSGTPNIYDQTGTPSLGTLPASTGGSTAFVCKFNSSGTYQYSRIVDSAATGTDQGLGLACDSSGNLYLTGYYTSTTGTATIKDQTGTSLGTLPTSLGGSTAFLCKFNSSGTYQYSRIVDTTNSDQGLAVTCDSSQNVYFAGNYLGTPNIYNQAGSNLGTLPTSTAQGAFVCKFNSSGTYQYSRIIDSSGADQAFGISCDSDDNIYVVGISGGTINIKNESGLILAILGVNAGAGFIVKFNSSGTYQYRSGRYCSSSCTGVICDANKNVYISGHTGSTNIFTLLNENASTIIDYTNSSVTGMGFVVKLEPSEIIPTAVIDTDISILNLAANTAITTQLTGWTATNNPTYQTAGGINGNKGYIRFTNTNTTNSFGLPQWMYWTGGNKSFNANSNRGYTIILYLRAQAQNTANFYDRIFHLNAGVSPGMIAATGGGANPKSYSMWTYGNLYSTNTINIAQGQWTLLCGRLNNRNNTFDIIYQTAAGVFTKSSTTVTDSYYDSTITSGDRYNNLVIAESENYTLDDAYFNGDFTRISLWDQPLSDSVLQLIFNTWL